MTIKEFLAAELKKLCEQLRWINKNLRPAMEQLLNTDDYPLLSDLMKLLTQPACIEYTNNLVLAKNLAQDLITLLELLLSGQTSLEHKQLLKRLIAQPELLFTLIQKSQLQNTIKEPTRIEKLFKEQEDIQNRALLAVKLLELFTQSNWINEDLRRAMQRLLETDDYPLLSNLMEMLTQEKLVLYVSAHHKALKYLRQLLNSLLDNETSPEHKQLLKRLIAQPELLSALIQKSQLKAMLQQPTTNLKNLLNEQADIQILIIKTYILQKTQNCSIIEDYCAQHNPVIAIPSPTQNIKQVTTEVCTSYFGKLNLANNQALLTELIAIEVRSANILLLVRASKQIDVAIQFNYNTLNNSFLPAIALLRQQSKKILYNENNKLNEKRDTRISNWLASCLMPNGYLTKTQYNHLTKPLTQNFFLANAPCFMHEYLVFILKKHGCWQEDQISLEGVNYLALYLTQLYWHLKHAAASSSVIACMTQQMMAVTTPTIISNELEEQYVKITNIISAVIFTTEAEAKTEAKTEAKEEEEEEEEEEAEKSSGMSNTLIKRLVAQLKGIHFFTQQGQNETNTGVNFLFEEVRMPIACMLKSIIPAQAPIFVNQAITVGSVTILLYIRTQDVYLYGNCFENGYLIERDPSLDKLVKYNQLTSQTPSLTAGDLTNACRTLGHVYSTPYEIALASRTIAQLVIEPARFPLMHDEICQLFPLEKPLSFQAQIKDYDNHYLRSMRIGCFALIITEYNQAIITHSTSFKISKILLAAEVELLLAQEGNINGIKTKNGNDIILPPTWLTPKIEEKKEADAVDLVEAAVYHLCQLSCQLTALPETNSIQAQELTEAIGTLNICIVLLQQTPQLMQIVLDGLTKKTGEWNQRKIKETNDQLLNQRLTYISNRIDMVIGDNVSPMRAALALSQALRRLGNLRPKLIENKPESFTYKIVHQKAQLSFIARVEQIIQEIAAAPDDETTHQKITSLVLWVEHATSLPEEIKTNLTQKITRAQKNLKHQHQATEAHSRQSLNSTSKILQELGSSQNRAQPQDNNIFDSDSSDDECILLKQAKKQQLAQKQTEQNIAGIENESGADSEQKIKLLQRLRDETSDLYKGTNFVEDLLRQIDKHISKHMVEIALLKLGPTGTK